MELSDNEIMISWYSLKSANIYDDVRNLHDVINKGKECYKNCNDKLH